MFRRSRRQSLCLNTNAKEAKGQGRPSRGRFRSTQKLPNLPCALNLFAYPDYRLSAACADAR